MIRTGRRAELWGAALLSLPLFSLGCDGCQKDKPYTPFGVTSSVPTGDASAAPPVSKDKPEPSKFAAAVEAPAGSRKLRMGELTLDAPPRYVFDRALLLGAAETLQAVAWVKAEPDARDIPPGLLMAYDAAEVPSSFIGELLMERLRDIDEVAYIRFASVYRSFSDLGKLREAVEELMESEALAGDTRTPFTNGNANNG